jgi:hypothetical protein
MPCCTTRGKGLVGLAWQLSAVLRQSPGGCGTATAEPWGEHGMEHVPSALSSPLWLEINKGTQPAFDKALTG